MTQRCELQHALGIPDGVHQTSRRLRDRDLPVTFAGWIPLRGSEQVPTISGDVEKYSHFAVGLGSRFSDEFDAT